MHYLRMKCHIEINCNYSNKALNANIATRIQSESFASCEKCKLLDNGIKPGIRRPRGGELAAEVCLLDGNHGDIATCPSNRGLVGEEAPDVNFGDPPYPLGEPQVDVIFGVAVGVRRGVICGVIENFCPVSLVAAPQRSP